MAFQLPKLPYGYDALEPHIDKKTMHIHHNKHHADYVTNLNKALEGHGELQDKSIESLLAEIDQVDEDIKQTVINNGGGHANHSLYWTIMNPRGGGEPKGDLADAINKHFGGLTKFKEEFSQKAVSLFGSGWVFLTIKDGKLVCKRHSFQNSPHMHGSIPLLGIDLWEHAYYLKYQNKKAEYISAWWNVVNWGEVASNFSKV